MHVREAGRRVDQELGLPALGEGRAVGQVSDGAFLARSWQAPEQAAGRPLSVTHL